MAIKIKDDMDPGLLELMFPIYDFSGIGNPNFIFGLSVKMFIQQIVVYVFFMTFNSIMFLFVALIPWVRM